MLAIHEDACLKGALARRHVELRSMEPGETIEEAVAHEMQEEAA